MRVPLSKLWPSSSTTVLKSDLSASKRFAPFLSLLGLLVVFTAITLFFSRQILSDATSASRATDGIMLVMVLVLPVTLAGAVGFQAFQLFSDHRKGRTGTSLKIRISLFFLLTTLLASVPQAALSISFIDAAIKTWSNQGWGDALQGGILSALDSHYERVQSLKKTVESPRLPEILQKAIGKKDPHALGPILEEMNLQAEGVQVFDEQDQLILQEGDPAAFLTEVKLPGTDGAIPPEVRGTSSIVRQIRHLDVGRRHLAVVVSVVLPPGFADKSQRLADALENYNQLKRSSDSYRSLFLAFYFLLYLPIVLIALLISFTQSEDLIRPLINLESATRRIAAGDYSTKLLGPEQSELAFLAESFNAMTAELASSRAKLLQTEKITAWQEIARRLAHELRNPLTPIRLSAERILKRNRSDPEHLSEIVEPAASAILTEVVRLDTLLKEFAGFARLPAPQKTVVRLRSLVDELLQTYQAAHPGLQISAEGLSSTVKVVADPAQLEQVFANLFKNAVEAMQGSGHLTVVSNLVKKGSASYCRVQIHDTGPGVPAALRDRIFQPYVTTKADGTGLGLAIVERILFDHQGRVWFESQPGYGTTFFLDLPEDPS